MADAPVPSANNTCQYCNKKFADKTKLGRHQKRSSCAARDLEATPWKCPICKLELPSKIQFVGHQKDSTCSGSKWQCSRCKKELACKRMVTRHIKSKVCTKACDSCVANGKTARCDAAKVEGPCSICQQMGVQCVKMDGTNGPSPIQVSRSRHEIANSRQQTPAGSLDSGEASDADDDDDDVDVEDGFHFINSTPADFARGAVPALAPAPDTAVSRAPTPPSAPAPPFEQAANVFGHQLGRGYQDFSSPYAAYPVPQPDVQNSGAYTTEGLTQGILFRSSHQTIFDFQEETGRPQPLHLTEQYEAAAAFGREMHRGLPDPMSNPFQSTDEQLEQWVSGMRDPWSTTVLTRENNGVVKVVMVPMGTATIRTSTTSPD